MVAFLFTRGGGQSGRDPVVELRDKGEDERDISDNNRQERFTD